MQVYGSLEDGTQLHTLLIWKMKLKCIQYMIKFIKIDQKLVHVSLFYRGAADDWEMIWRNTINNKSYWKTEENKIKKNWYKYILVD